MDIPKSLESTWARVSQDGTISKADYDTLAAAAAPNKSVEELDDSEIAFLQSLRSELESNGGTKGRIPVNGISFASEAQETAIVKKVSSKDIGEIPETLKAAWNNAMEDGKISSIEYRVLVDVASPNWSDGELDDKEKNFLANLKGLLQSSKNILEVVEPKVEQKVAKAPEKIPENNVEEEEETVIQTGTVSSDNGLDLDLTNLNQVKSILEDLGDDPDFAPLKSIVDQRIQANSSAKHFISNVQDIMGKIQPDKLASLTSAKTKIESEYNSLSEGIKNNPQIKQIFTDAVNNVSSSINSLKVKLQKANTATKTKTQQKQPVQTQDNSGVPASMKTAWNKAVADGKVTVDDFEKLKLAAAPNKKNTEFSDEELNFLASVYEQIQNNGGVYSFVDDKASNTTSSDGVPASMKTAWKQATADGKLTVQDFEKLKLAAAPNKKNTEFDDEELNFLASIFEQLQQNGGVIQVEQPKQTQQTQNVAVSDDGVPASMKAAWKQVTADGKVTVQDFEKLKLAAAPNKKNTEFDDEELNFLASIFEQIQQNGGVLQVEQPKQTQQTQNVVVSDEGVPASMKAAWKQATADGKLTVQDFEKLKLAAAPNKKNTEFDDEELNFLASIFEQIQQNGGVIEFASKPENRPSSDGFDVPSTLKQVWNNVTKDGVLTSNEFDSLIKAAAPGDNMQELDNNEKKFLTQIKEKFINQDGTLNDSISVGSKSSDKPVLMNWPGYTKETKDALKNAYGKSTIGKDMPLLPTQLGKQVAQAFGTTSIIELQKLVNAKTDGKFGPETFFKAKIYAANMLNKNREEAEKIALMLSALGNDPEVAQMKSALTSTPKIQEVQQPKKEETTTTATVNLGGINPDDQTAVANLQKKINLLSGVFEKTQLVSCPKVPVDGKVTPQFAKAMDDIKKVMGSSPVEAVTYVEEAFKKEMGVAQLDTQSAKFLHFQDNEFVILGNKKDVTRIESAKVMLNKLGLNIGSYKLEIPEDPKKNGDIVLVGNGFRLNVFDNLQTGRDSNSYGDLHISGKFAGKDVNISYWENQRRGQGSVDKQGKFHIESKIDGKTNHLKNNEGFLPNPLVVIK